jgi:hypothetical protein
MAVLEVEMLRESDDLGKLIVTVPFWEEHTALQNLSESFHVPLVQLGHAIIIALFSRLVSDSPVGIIGVCDMLSMLENIELDESEI